MRTGQRSLVGAVARAPRTSISWIGHLHMGTWSEESIGDLSGKRVVVTGANSGVGYYTAKVLARHGADVVMACRDQERSQKPFEEVCDVATGTVVLRPLDLADLDSVSAFADNLRTDFTSLDLLINNAGIMGGPQRTTAQGFELQMGTNHLGHFALTNRLWPLLAATGNARVVSLSSIAAHDGRLSAAMTRETLVDPSPYNPFNVYSNTKQATLLFAQELHRRAQAAGADVASLAAHPGVSSTGLFNRQLRERHLGALVPIVGTIGRITLASPRSSANPSIRAATDPTIHSGDFVGPSLLGQSRGKPEVIKVFREGRDPETAARLWELSEQITGEPFTL